MATKNVHDYYLAGDYIEVIYQGQDQSDDILILDLIDWMEENHKLNCSKCGKLPEGREVTFDIWFTNSDEIEIKKILAEFVNRPIHLKEFLFLNPNN